MAKQAEAVSVSADKKGEYLTKRDQLMATIDELHRRVAAMAAEQAEVCSRNRMSTYPIPIATRVLSHPVWFAGRHSCCRSPQALPDLTGGAVDGGRRHRQAGASLVRSIRVAHLPLHHSIAAPGGQRNALLVLHVCVCVCGVGVDEMGWGGEEGGSR